jgi:hypothetical protein
MKRSVLNPQEQTIVYGHSTQTHPMFQMKLFWEYQLNKEPIDVTLRLGEKD